MSIRLFRACAAFMVFAGVLALSGSAQAQGDAWSRLKAGDWAKYKSTPAPGMETQMTWKVKSAEGGKVVYTVETTTLMNGTAVSPPVSTELTYDASATVGTAAASAEAVKPTESEATVQVNGKDLKCKVTTVEAGGMKSTTWMSDDVPFGIVKVEAAGVVAQELVEWGSAS